MLEACLDDLEQRIDTDVEDALYREWSVFLDGRFEGDLFTPQRRAAAVPGCPWPEVTVNQAWHDPDAMLLQQFRLCSDALADAGGQLLAVRCNYGTGIMPSLFGAEIFMMDEALNTLPTSKPLSGGTDALRLLLDRGVPAPEQGLGCRTLDTAARFIAAMRDYPKISRSVHLYHPDLQGPMDICELLWGSGLFLDLVDEPQLVHDVLALVTETYITFLRRWAEIVPFAGDRTVHWSMLHRGHVMLRDDSAMNLSPAMVAEFVTPYDQRILDAFDGGGIHFCGRGDHYIALLSEMPGLHAVAMSQPECNDMETVFRHTVDKDIPLIGFPRAAAEAALKRGRSLHGRVHSW